MQRQLVAALLSLSVTGVASAQNAIGSFVGPSPNIPTSAIDFDNPFVPSGPPPANMLMGTGITSITVVGAGWTAAGDTLTAGSNVNGQCFVVDNGVASIGGVGDPLDQPGAGDGFDIVLDNLSDEFQVLFADQVNFSYDVELFNGATSLGSSAEAYNGAFPNPPAYFRACDPAGMPLQFDRILITFGGTGGVGIDELGFGNGPGPCPPPPPPPPGSNCAETLFAANNGGNVGGGVYFDITVTQNISVAGLLANTSVNGFPVGMTVYTIPGTYVGNETNMAAWTMVAEDDGLSVGLGQNAMTPLNFVTPFSLAPGTYGVALIGDNFTTGSQMDHDYTNGTGANQQAVSPDGVITLDLGTASNAGFTAPIFDPRVWNGTICSSGPISPGTNYCTANVNSTGVAASISATGSAVVSVNDLTLVASDMPNASFGFFLTSMTQAFTMNPGGSQGNLCLGGAIGRYVGPGQIQNSGGSGSISLSIDNSMQPTPTGLVQVVAGETWNFTTWFRDTDGMGGATSNFSDGLEVLFQ